MQGRYLYICNWWKFTSNFFDSANVRRSAIWARRRCQDSWDSKKNVRKKNILVPKITFRIELIRAALQIRPFPLVKVLQSFDSRRQGILRHRKRKLVEPFLSSYISEQRKFSKRNKICSSVQNVTLLNNQVLNLHMCCKICDRNTCKMERTEE